MGTAAAMLAAAVLGGTPVSIQIAPLDEALTFARADGRLIAVRSYEDGRVRGADLGPEDAIDAFGRLGYDALRREIEAAPPIEAAASDLGIPVHLEAAHIAVGTNYPEHADEASVKGGPFLFPKLVVPTGARAPIPAGEALLDYEVELCLVTMKPLAPGEPASGGLILCNDVTDRARLLRGVDPRRPQSGKGFTDGKSAPGYLPVGDLFVVPRDLAVFTGGLTLQLSVNGRERQRAPVSQWIWDFDEILRQARARRSVEWSWREGTARLPFTATGDIPPRTLILAGTPAGTVFNGLAGRDFAGGLMDWLLGGWGRSPAHHVIERHIAAARGYLQPGDEVTIRVDRLGAMAGRVVDQAETSKVGQ